MPTDPKALVTPERVNWLNTLLTINSGVLSTQIVDKARERWPEFQRAKLQAWLDYWY